MHALAGGRPPQDDWDEVEAGGAGDDAASVMTAATDPGTLLDALAPFVDAEPGLVAGADGMPKHFVGEVEPDERGAVPIALAYRSRLHVRPAPVAGAGPGSWSAQPILWQRALRHPVAPVKTSVHWQLEAVPQFAEPSARLGTGAVVSAAASAVSKTASLASRSVHPAGLRAPTPAHGASGGPDADGSRLGLAAATVPLSAAHLRDTLRRYPALALHLAAPLRLQNLTPVDLQYTVQSGTHAPVQVRVVLCAHEPHAP
jgi:hypothetical protein